MLTQGIVERDIGLDAGARFQQLLPVLRQILDLPHKVNRQLAGRGEGREVFALRLHVAVEDQAVLEEALGKELGAFHAALIGLMKKLVARALVDPIDLRVARDEAPQWFADEGEDRALLHRFQVDVFTPIEVIFKGIHHLIGGANGLEVFHHRIAGSFPHMHVHHVMMLLGTASHLRLRHLWMEINWIETLILIPQQTLHKGPHPIADLLQSGQTV
mmetsp:Transcript_10828/g.18356  ORF Transcript_10828/g.18356 Transcript_10828/m.18356 type:complete len:216 (-) Transcript_10828:252-899(-)